MLVYQFSIIQMAAHATLSKAGRKNLEDFSLNSAQWRILGLLSEHPTGARIADIEAVTFIQSTQVNPLIKELLSRQLIRKTPHPEDGRANLLLITSRGRDVLDEIESRMQKTLADIMQDATSDDFQIYMKVLQSIIKYGNSQGDHNGS